MDSLSRMTKKNTQVTFSLGVSVFFPGWEHHIEVLRDEEGDEEMV